MVPIVLSKPRPQLKFQETPPYLGYGTVEDSLASVKALAPKPPKKDVQKIFKNDLHILRFDGKIVSCNPDDESRNFIISFYCGDDTIKIHEVAERNSGRIGGKFLDRKKHLNPVNGQYYSEKDMLLGSLLLLGGHKFRLVQCDEYTEKYFEANPEVFKEASIDCVLSKLRLQGKGFPAVADFAKSLRAKLDTKGNGILSCEEFCNSLKAANLVLTFHELHTLVRNFDPNKENRISLDEFCGAIGSQPSA